MEFNEIITVLVALGGFEGLRQLAKWWTGRKQEARINDAKADMEEFHLLREVNVFLQEQLKLKEERFAEQTNIVRKQNEELLRFATENSELKAERRMKLCERKGCGDRQPQSGY